MPSTQERSTRTRLILAAIVAVGGGLTLGCGQSNPAALGTGSSSGDDASAVGCALPNQGCPCSTAGQVVACGEVVTRAGNFVTCSEGNRTCAGGTWGACVGSTIHKKSAAPIGGGGGGGLRPEGLGMSTTDAGVCVNNPCDPECNTFINDPSGLDAGAESGLNITDSGVTLNGTAVTITACSALQVTPNTSPAKDLTITTMAPSPNTVQYTASLVPPSCYPAPPAFLWSIDQYDIAQISTNGLLTLAVPIAGPITVTAYAGTLSAAVVCNVTVKVVDTSAAPVGYTNAQFPVTTGVADTIQVLYPYAGTVFPLGLPSPLIQWSNGGTTANAAKVTLRFPSSGTPIFSWSEIVPELQTAPTPSLAAQPRATIPQTVWIDFQQTVVRQSGATGGDAVFAIQRVVGGVLRAEVPTIIHFANGQLKGNIYYNSYGTNLVHNFCCTAGGQPFGAATLEVPVNGTSPTVVVGYNDPTNSGAGCRVCHSVAANGTRILSNSYLLNGNSGGGSEQTTFTYNPLAGTPAQIQASETLVGSFGSNVFTFGAVSPDGTYLFNSAGPASSNGAANLYTLGGSVIASNVPSGLHAATPTFSPDAAHLAFNDYGGDGKSLHMIDFAPPATFSNLRNLYTPSSLYSVWPSFLPPGQNGVVFQNEVTANGRDWAGTRSQCDSSGSCNSVGATAELWWVSTGASPAAAKLTNMNGGAYLPRNSGALHGTSADNGTYYEEVYNYEPTVLPITIGGYSWVAFTSRRLYGNVATINPYWSDPRFQDISVQPTTKKIWIAAISGNPTPGADPSFPAFYLPGQELLAGNARAYFALAACEAPGPPTPATLCTSNLDCCGGTASPPTAICQLDPPPLANPPVSHCVAVPSSSCVADGASCTADAQCCNFPSGSRCGSGICAPSPPLVLYSPAVFTTTYTGSCNMGFAPAWRFFYWETNTPNGTSIGFQAQTSPDGVTWGTAVGIGTAQPPPNVTPTWTSGLQTVDQALQANGQKSQRELKVIATLNPDATGQQAPVLTNWQLQYDCVPAE
jgi:hypothetical protein